jgi:hypothetical protein
VPDPGATAGTTRFLCEDATFKAPPGVDTSPWTAYTPSVGATTGALSNASATGRYKQIGKTVFVQITISIVAVGSASGFVTATLPVAGNANGSYMLVGREGAVAGFTVVGLIAPSATAVEVIRYDNTTTIGASYSIPISGVYEAA